MRDCDPEHLVLLFLQNRRFSGNKNQNHLVLQICQSMNSYRNLVSVSHSLYHRSC
jgi:hypothetical protein